MSFHEIQNDIRLEDIKNIFLGKLSETYRPLLISGITPRYILDFSLKSKSEENHKVIFPPAPWGFSEESANKIAEDLRKSLVPGSQVQVKKVG